MDSTPPDTGFDRLIPLYLVLHIVGGQVGLPIIIATLLTSKKVARHPTLVNFFCTWVIYSIVYCILLYSGQRHQPPSILCEVQSALVHGASPMCVVATLALVIQLWSTLREPPLQRTTVLSRSRWPSTLRLRIMLVVPYIVFVTFVILTALLQRRKGVVVGSWTGLYCTLEGEMIVRYAVPAFCTATLVIIVGFEVAIVVRYFRMQRTISGKFPLADTQKWTAMIIRVFAFSVYTLVTLCAGVLFLSGNTSPWPYMVQAALPLSALLVFGTQKDIFLIWVFWKPYPAIPPFDIPPKHPQQQSSRESILSDDTVLSAESIPTHSIGNV